MPRHRADIAALNRIAALLVDATRLYARAARLTEAAEAVEGIERTLGERAQLLGDIHQRVRDMDVRPSRDGSMLGAAQKAWLDVRALFERDSEAALAEVERAEKYLRDEVRRCMRREELSAETRAFFGIVLDRLVSGGQRIEGARERVERKAPAPL